MSAQVQGHCPACGGTSLFLGSGGYVTCSRSDCPRPDAASDILADGETQHIVLLRDTDFIIQHPLAERLEGGLFQCPLNDHLHGLSGPPFQPGRYRVHGNGAGEGRWQRLPEEVTDA